MSGKWGIKTREGYINFIHGTVDEVWDFETSPSIDDVCIFDESVAKRYASSLQSITFPIYISETQRLTKRDLTILSAYTGYMFGEFQNFHDYAEEIIGHSIFTHQFGDKQMSEKLHKLSKEDFLQLHEKMIRENEMVISWEI